VHCHYGTITSFISLLGASSVPFVVTFHGSDVNGANDISKLRSSLGVFLSKFTSRFTSSNIVSNESLKIKLPVSAQRKSTVVPMGINIHVFKPIDRSACRKKLDWKDDDFVVLFNANNPIVKRLDIALDVKQRLESMHSDIRFEILSGHVDSDLIPTLLNAVNCVLVCSDSEGSPTIVKEALACNTSVVSNDVGDVKTRISGVMGCYLCEQNPEAYVASILKLYHSKEPCNGLDKIVKDELTDEQITRKIISVYSEAVKR
jgi:glycosyltransferase involved in cell wall biosynthesis